MKSKDIVLKDKSFGIPQRSSGLFAFGSRSLSSSSIAPKPRLNIKTNKNRTQTQLTSFFNTRQCEVTKDTIAGAFNSLLEVDEDFSDQDFSGRQVLESTTITGQIMPEVTENTNNNNGMDSTDKKDTNADGSATNTTNLSQGDIQAIAEKLFSMMPGQANNAQPSTSAQQAEAPKTYFPISRDFGGENQGIPRSHSNPCFNGQQNNPTNMFDIELEQFRLTRASEKSCLNQHPWLKFTFYFGFTKIVKDLRSITCDWLTIRSILRWAAESDETIQASLMANSAIVDNQQFNQAFHATVTHRRMLLFAISKIISVYIIFDDKQNSNGGKNANTANNSPASLLLRIVNVIDSNFYAGNIMTEQMVKETISDFISELDIPKRNLQISNHANKNTSSSSKGYSGKSVRVLLCNDFNSANGCSYGDSCKFKHSCRKHYQKDGSFHSHSAATCTLGQ